MPTARSEAGSDPSRQSTEYTVVCLHNELRSGGLTMPFMRKLVWLLRRRRKEAELRQELEFHLAEEARERQSDGLAPQEARWAAHRDLGNTTLVEENVRAVWIWTFWERLLHGRRRESIP
jgi:hypothetical protein